MRGYELWDTRTNNLLDDFETKSAALACVREWMAQESEDCVASVALVAVADDGSSRQLALGSTLAALARSAPAVRSGPPVD